MKTAAAPRLSSSRIAQGGEDFPGYLSRQAKRTQFKATAMAPKLKPASMAQPVAITPAKAAGIRMSVKSMVGGR